MGHFERKFQGEKGVPNNDFWHQKSRVPELSYGEKNAEKFNRLSRVHQRHRQHTDNRQTDRQTDGRPIAYSERNVVRSLKIKCSKERRSNQNVMLYVTEASNTTLLFIQ